MVKVQRGSCAGARPLCLLRARLAAPDSSSLSHGGAVAGRPATASGARASRLQSQPPTSPPSTVTMDLLLWASLPDELRQSVSPDPDPDPDPNRPSR